MPDIYLRDSGNEVISDDLNESLLTDIAEIADDDDVEDLVSLKPDEIDDFDSTDTDEAENEEVDLTETVSEIVTSFMLDTYIRDSDGEAILDNSGNRIQSEVIETYVSKTRVLL